MKVCVVGDFSGNSDEGMKKIASEIYKMLEKNCKVYKFDISRIFSTKIWVNLRKFDPQVIHYIPGPSTSSFIFLWILRLLTNTPKTVMMATHPKIGNIGKYLIQLFRPDVILTQSNKTDIFFSELKFNTQFFPNGVDNKIFCHIPKEQKINLRKKYGFNEDAFIILHVGHIKEKRNINFFCELKKRVDNDVVIVGSTSTKADNEIVNNLKYAGCRIFNNYIQKIQEIYQLSDIYIFPTMDQENCVEIPLSILEALACGLPVISTRFGGIDKLLHDFKGLIIVENVEEIFEKITSIKNNDLKLDHSDTISFDWKKLNRNINIIYKEINVRNYETKNT